MSNQNNPTSDNAAYLARMTGYNVSLPTPHSENTEYLAEVVERIEAMSHIGRYLSTWNCTTGLPSTNPQTNPYTYLTGDYFVVGVVAASGGTNYKPNGTSYNGTASTTVDTSTIAIGDMYRFDGTAWELLKFSAALNNYVATFEQAFDSTQKAQARANIGITELLSAKVDKAQGVAHAGEFLVVGADGNVTTQTLQVWQGGSY